MGVKQTEALRLALEALEVATTPLAKDRQEVLRAQAAIREALAEQVSKDKEQAKTDAFIKQLDQALAEQPAQQEQLREENERLHVENRRLIDRIETIGAPVGVGGFATTTTAQRTWVGLTNQELIDLTAIYSGAPLYCAIEAKLREKNT